MKMIADEGSPPIYEFVSCQQGTLAEALANRQSLAKKLVECALNVKMNLSLLNVIQFFSPLLIKARSTIMISCIPCGESPSNSGVIVD